MSIPEDFVLKEVIGSVTSQIDLALTHSLDVSVNDIALRSLESHFRQHPSKMYNQTKPLLERFKDKKITDLTEQELSQLTKLIKMLSLYISGPIEKQLNPLLSGATAKSIEDGLKQMKRYLPTFSDQELKEVETGIAGDFNDIMGGEKFDKFAIKGIQEQFEVDNIEHKRFSSTTITFNGESFHFDSDHDIRRFQDKAMKLSSRVSKDPRVQKKFYDSILLFGTQTYFNCLQRDRLALATPIFTGITEAYTNTVCTLGKPSVDIEINVDKENLTLDVKTKVTTFVKPKVLFKEGQQEKGEALLQLAQLNYLAGITTSSSCRVSIDPEEVKASATLGEDPSVAIFTNPRI